MPLAELAHAARALGHINLAYDSDGVVRSVYLHEGQNGSWWPHFALALSDPAHAGNRYTDSGTPDRSEHRFAGWQRAEKILIPFAGSNGHFRTVPYVSALRGEVPAQFFSGKHVLVGATALGMADAYATPVSGESGSMSGIEIHANILAGLLDHQSITLARAWQTALFSMATVFIALLAYLWLSPRSALLANKQANQCFASLGLRQLQGAAFADLCADLHSPQPIDQAIDRQFDWPDLLDVQQAVIYANGINARDRRVDRPGLPDQPQHDGIGLGPVFVKTVVERHHGQISLSSQVGVGTTLTLVLPGSDTVDHPQDE